MSLKYQVDMSRELGTGFASVVYLGFNIVSSEAVCVKVIDLLSCGQKQLEMILREIKCLK